jgi:threonine/homoserine/homoserine lactone efflux protein
MKRHRFDPFSFLVGAIFFSLGISIAADGGSDALRSSHLWPVVIVVLGGALLAWVAIRIVGGDGRRATVAAVPEPPLGAEPGRVSGPADRPDDGPDDGWPDPPSPPVD